MVDFRNRRFQMQRKRKLFEISPQCVPEGLNCYETLLGEAMVWRGIVVKVSYINKHKWDSNLQNHFNGTNKQESRFIWKKKLNWVFVVWMGLSTRRYFNFNFLNESFDILIHNSARFVLYENKSPLVFLPLFAQSSLHVFAPLHWLMRVEWLIYVSAN